MTLRDATSFAKLQQSVFGIRRATASILVAGFSLILLSPLASFGSTPPTWVNATFNNLSDDFPAAPIGTFNFTNTNLVTFEVETPASPVAFGQITLTVRGIRAPTLDLPVQDTSDANLVALKSGATTFGFIEALNSSDQRVLVTAASISAQVADNNTRLALNVIWGADVPGGHKFRFSFESGQLERTEAQASVDVIGISGHGTPNAKIEYETSRNYGTGSSGAQSTQTAPTAPPAKYSGPEFSSLSLKPVMHGSSTTLAGKRLSQVSSIEIGGKAATFTAASDTELSLTPAADLAPGTYDLVIHSSAGKLTHINAVRVQPALRPFSITTRSEGRISETQYYEHSLIASMQQPELTKARCIVNGSNLALAKAQAERLCALVAAANPNIETTVIEPRSTVKNNTVFARVTYGWN